MKTSIILLVFGLIAFSYCKSEVPKDGRSGNAAGRAALRQELFDDYDKMNIPDDVTVKFGATLLTLDANEDKGTLESDAWLKYSWIDSRLKWDSSTNNIDVLRVGSQEIWKPDITLFNSANLKDMVNCWDSNPLIYSSGKVLWIPPCQIHTPCNFTLEKFPYGEQKCQWKFGSWTYDANLMGMDFFEDKKEVELDYFGSTEWKIVNTKAVRHEKHYPCCSEPYVDITFDLTIKRHEYFSCKRQE